MRAKSVWQRGTRLVAVRSCLDVAMRIAVIINIKHIQYSLVLFSHIHTCLDESLQQG